MYYIVDQGIIRRADSTVRHLVALTIDGEVMVLVMIRVISFTYHYELKKQQQQYLRTWLGGWDMYVYHCMHHMCIRGMHTYTTHTTLHYTTPDYTRLHYIHTYLRASDENKSVSDDCKCVVDCTFTHTCELKTRVRVFLMIASVLLIAKRRI